MLNLQKAFYLVVIFVITTVGFCGQVHADLEMSVPVYGQGQQGQSWAGDQLGTCYPETIGSHGCVITSIAMVFKYYGISTDPRGMNNWLKQHNGYSGGCLVKWDVAAGCSNGSIQWAGRYDYQTIPADLNKINSEINNGYPVIAEVRLSGYMHFVVITGYSGSTYYINDPWYGDSSTINSRYNSNPATAIYGIRLYHGPSNRTPEGYLDHADCNTIGGWARDPDTTNAIRVDFYKDAPAGSGTFIGNTFANVYRSDLTFSDKNHGFVFTTPNSLKDGKTHTIYAYAIDSEGGTNPLLSDSPKTITCGSAPSPPSNVQASDCTYTDKVRITWSSSSGATSYEVYRATSSGGTKSKIGTPSGAYYNDTSASVGTTYYYWVKAKNAYGTSGYSSYNTGYRAGTLPSIETRPATNKSDTGAILNGRTVSDGGSSIIERRFDWGLTSSCSDGWTSSVGISGDYFSYYLYGLNPGTTYYFRAWAKNSAGWGHGEVLSFQTSGTVPLFPTNVQASDGTYTDKVRITWSSSSGATSYEVYRATSSGGTKSKVGTPSGTYYNDTSASIGTTYYYWIKATNSYGESGFSSYNTGYRKSCTYSISPTSKSFISSGGGGAVSVTVQNDCPWTAASNAGWITITAGTSGSGNGTVDYSVASNSSASLRTGNMTIAGKTFTVTQEGGNVSPTADAGPDQTVDEREIVVLDGSNSSDPDDGIASYQWVQTADPSVTLSNSEAVQPTFTAPNVGTEGATLTFQLKVSDNGGLQDTDTVIINISNKIIAGDVDDSGTVDLSDAVMALQVSVGINPSQTVYNAADVNGDNNIGLEEVVYILQKIAGLRN